MALIACPDCGSTVSDAAASCLECGRPIRATPLAATRTAKILKTTTQGGDSRAGCLAVAGIVLLFVAFPLGVIVLLSGAGLFLWQLAFPPPAQQFVQYSCSACKRGILNPTVTICEHCHSTFETSP